MSDAKRPLESELRAAFDAHLQRLQDLASAEEVPLALLDNAYTLATYTFSEGSEAAILAASLLSILATANVTSDETASEARNKVRRLTGIAREAVELLSKVQSSGIEKANKLEVPVPAESRGLVEIGLNILGNAQWLEAKLSRVNGHQALTTLSDWLVHRRTTITALVDMNVPPENAHGCFPCEMGAETKRKQLREYRTTPG